MAGGEAPKTLIIRAIGPSLASTVPGAMQDPVLELHAPDGSVITNDNWQSDQESEIEASGLAPTNDLESAIVATLSPVDPGDPGSGLYSAIVSGKGGATGIALVEVYDLDDPNGTTYLANISTRGFIQTADKVMIGGFIIGEGAELGQVVVRAIGPSLSGLPGTLPDPVLSLYDAEGTLLEENDNWQDSNGEAIAETGLAPTDAAESAILASLAPGPYTAVVRGQGDTTGIGLVEVYYIP